MNYKVKITECDCEFVSRSMSDAEAQILLSKLTDKGITNIHKVADQRGRPMKGIKQNQINHT